jgi:hypothetical protein
VKRLKIGYIRKIVTILPFPAKASTGGLTYWMISSAGCRHEEDMRNGMIFYITIHIILVALGSLIAAISAPDYAEPTLNICGFLFAVSLYIAFLAYGRNRTLCLYYALTTATVSIICLAALLGLNSRSCHIRFPIGIFMASFGLFNIPFGIVTLLDVKRRRRGCRRKGPFQYSIAAIIGLTSIVAVSISLIKTLGNQGFALAILLCYFVFLGYVLMRFHKYDRNAGKI